MGDVAYSEASKDQYQVLSEFEGQLSRLDSILDSISAKLHPILEAQGPESLGPIPEEAPVHDLHNSILRLRRLNNRLDAIYAHIRL